MSKQAFFAAIILAIATCANASSERILVPIHARGVAGANGSVWSSYLSITNHSDLPVLVFGVTPCEIAPCIPDPILPGASLSSCGFSSFIEADGGSLDGLSFLLRVRDESRQGVSWGTSIPTVRERDAFVGSSVISLLDIPTTSEYRTTLRVYDFDSSAARQVEIRYYALESQGCLPPPAGDRLLFETIETFGAPAATSSAEPPLIAIQLSNVPQILGHDRVRIEIAPVTSGLRFWAFASVTQNNNQQTTTIAP